MHALHALRRNRYTYLTRQDVDGRASITKWVYIDITDPMPVASARGRDYVSVVASSYTRAVYTRPLRLKSEVLESLKTFRAVAEVESGKWIREIMTAVSVSSLSDSLDDVNYTINYQYFCSQTILYCIKETLLLTKPAQRGPLPCGATYTR